MKNKKVNSKLKNDDVITKARTGTNSSGNVKITLIKGGKEIGKIITHNTGTIYLCDYLVHAIVGDYIIATRPGVIVPYTGTGESAKQIGNGSPYVSSKVKLGADAFENGWKDEEDNTDPGFCTAIITFLIPSSIISGSEINGFYLLSKDDSRKLYATVALDEPLNISGDTNLKVEWTLYISYKWDIDRAAKSVI